MKSSSARRRSRRAATRRGRSAVSVTAGGRVRSQEKPPHVEFALRAQGTLPEIITEANLETLNLGLRFLFARLREARQQFESEGDGGRKGAFTALAATWMFIVLFEEPCAESLHIPILRLQDALVSLEQNLVLPIVERVRRPGRARSSVVHASLRGHAAGTVRRLMQTDLDAPEAYRAVAKVLTRRGVKAERGSGKITADTVRHWCVDELPADVGRHGPAAWMYDFNVYGGRRSQVFVFATDPGTLTRPCFT
jgi:hypothetical protein